METIREGDAVSFFNSNLDDYIFLYPNRLATYTHTHTHTLVFSIYVHDNIMYMLYIILYEYNKHI